MDEIQFLARIFADYPDEGCEYAHKCISCHLPLCAHDELPPPDTPFVNKEVNIHGQNPQADLDKCTICGDKSAHSLGLGKSRKLCPRHAQLNRERQARHQQRKKESVSNG